MLGLCAQVPDEKREDVLKETLDFYCSPGVSDISKVCTI